MPIAGHALRFVTDIRVVSRKLVGYNRAHRGMIGHIINLFGEPFGLQDAI